MHDPEGRALERLARLADGDFRRSVKAAREFLRLERLETWKVHGRDEHGRPICHARNRRGVHERCHRFPVADNGRCRQHGGLSDGSGNLRHGRRSKVLGRRAIQEAFARPDLFFPVY
jgi:hypothetical protein